jgi:hypothetical protein
MTNTDPRIIGIDPTGFVVALRDAHDCGATTAYRYPDSLACTRCGHDRTAPAEPWKPGLDKNSAYRAAALTNPARVR